MATNDLDHEVSYISSWVKCYTSIKLSVNWHTQAITASMLVNSWLEVMGRLFSGEKFAEILW